MASNNNVIAVDAVDVLFCILKTFDIVHVFHRIQL